MEPLIALHKSFNECLSSVYTPESDDIASLAIFVPLAISLHLSLIAQPMTLLRN